MISLDDLRELMVWCAAINIVLLAVMVLTIWSIGDLVAGVHARMFKLDARDLPGLYFSYIANFKLATLIFTVVPYVALVSMT